MKIKPIASTTALFAAAAMTLPASAADAPKHHVRGTVSAIAGNMVTIATAKGSVVVTLTPKTRFVQVVPGTASDITPGTFIGTANVVTGSAPARALEVVVFPKAMAGTGEGDYPWDLPASGGTSQMTNGTVAAPKMSAMTNATVTHVANGAGKTVTLAYKGGTKVVSIGSGIPIVRMAPATRALLVTGAHVVAFPPANAAGAIVIGEKGATPPM